MLFKEITTNPPWALLTPRHGAANIRWLDIGNGMPPIGGMHCSGYFEHCKVNVKVFTGQEMGNFF